MKIVLDAGHGMSNTRPGVFDPGACDVTGKRREADCSFMWGQVGARILPLYGLTVILTRLTSLSPAPLSRRVSLTNEDRADFFLALHCNSSDTGDASGAETLYRDAADRTFAEVVQGSILKAMGGKDRKVKPENSGHHSRLRVFDVNCKAALVEKGFISNPDECAKMFRVETAEAFFHALGKAMQAIFKIAPPAKPWRVQVAGSAAPLIANCSIVENRAAYPVKALLLGIYTPKLVADNLRYVGAKLYWGNRWLNPATFPQKNENGLMVVAVVPFLQLIGVPVSINEDSRIITYGGTN